MSRAQTAWPLDVRDPVSQVACFSEPGYSLCLRVGVYLSPKFQCVSVSYVSSEPMTSLSLCRLYCLLPQFPQAGENSLYLLKVGRMGDTELS